MRPTLLLAGLVSMLPLAGQEGGGVVASIEVSGLVQDEIGRPLEDVAVAWVADAHWSPDQLVAAERTRTDARGRYTCRVASGDGYRADFDDLRSRLPWLVFSRPGRATSVCWLAGSDDRHVDVRMLPGGTLRVHVVDERGEPVPQAMVRAEVASPPQMAAGAMPASAARTDSEGLAVLRGVPLTGVEAVVDEPGWAVVRTEPLALGQDVTLRTERTGFLRGRVVAVPGLPKGGWVEVFDRAGGFREVPLDATGRFVVGRVSRLPHRLRVTDAVLTGRVIGSAAGWLEGARDDVEIVVGARELDPVAVRVVDDVTGEPIAGARVAWMHGSIIALINAIGRGFQRFDDEATTATDARGIARVPAPMYDGSTRPLVLATAPGRDFGWAWIPESRPTEPLEVRLTDAPDVRGVVLTADRAPVAGARVHAVPSRSPDLPLRHLHRAPWVTTTDREGRFVFEGLPVFGWRLVVVAPGHAAYSKTRVEIEAGVEPSPVEIELPREFEVAGRITDAVRLPAGSRVLARQPQAALDAFVVGAPDPRRDRAVLLDAEGRFRIRGLRAGRYTLSILPPATGFGGAPPEVELETFDVQSSREDLILDGKVAEPATLAGRLEFAGAELPDGRFAVRVRPVLEVREHLADETRFLADCFTVLDRGGSFTLQLPKGRWQLEALDLLGGHAFPVGEVVEIWEPGQQVEWREEVRVGTVVVRLRPVADRHGGFGSRLRVVRDLLQKPIGFGPMEEGGLLENQLRLAGRGGRFEFVLPIRTHGILLWGESAAPPLRDLVMRLFTGELSPGLQLPVTVEAGDVVEIVVGLPESK